MQAAIAAKDKSHLLTAVKCWQSPYRTFSIWIQLQEVMFNICECCSLLLLDHAVGGSTSDRSSTCPVVSIESIPRELSCYWKHSAEHRMCVNAPLTLLISLISVVEMELNEVGWCRD